MNNKKILKIKFKNMDTLKNELLNLSRKKDSFIQPSDVILFESIAGFRNFMTLQKIELLMLITSKNPKSIYELSKLADRSIAPVQKDCQMLEQTGFIIFDKQNGGRQTLTPKLKFNYDKILIELPDHPYELSFAAA